MINIIELQLSLGWQDLLTHICILRIRYQARLCKSCVILAFAHIKQTMKSIHITVVTAFLSTITSKVSLTKSLCRTQTQLRTNKAPFLLSYLHKSMLQTIHHHSVPFVPHRHFTPLYLHACTHAAKSSGFID